MGDLSGARRGTPSVAGPVDVVGLGPGTLERTPAEVRELLFDPDRRVVVRTLQHPAAEELARRRPVVSCDDLYETADDFEAVYAAIVDRLLDLARTGPVVYAVPGSPLVGERAVGELRRRVGAAVVRVWPAESFIDAVCALVGVDPLDRGLRILDAHRLPDPLLIDGPTLLAQVDHPLLLADLCARLGTVLPEGTEVSVVVDAGGPDERVVRSPVDRVDPRLAGLRTSLFLDPEPGGLPGAVRVMRRLREECPWDRAQTHHGLVANLMEEAAELADALAALPADDTVDHAAYASVEDELGDLLLQVLFHSVIARERGAFDIEDVAENLRRKLVRRHPHVFGDVVVSSAEEVKANWDAIKARERGDGGTRSTLDGIPEGMPALGRAAKVGRRAAKVGFDWPDIAGVFDKVREELAELEAVAGRPDEALDELGDLLFAVVNLARHLDVEPEAALRRATQRFIRRFRLMEEEGPLHGLALAELEARWEAAKDDEGSGVVGGTAGEC